MDEGPDDSSATGSQDGWIPLYADYLEDLSGDQRSGQPPALGFHTRDDWSTYKAVRNPEGWQAKCSWSELSGEQRKNLAVLGMDKSEWATYQDWLLGEARAEFSRTNHSDCQDIYDVIECMLHRGKALRQTNCGAGKGNVFNRFQSSQERAKATGAAKTGYLATMLSSQPEIDKWPFLCGVFVKAGTGVPTALAMWAALIGHPVLDEFFRLAEDNHCAGDDNSDCNRFDSAVFFGASDLCGHPDLPGWTIGHCLVEAGSLDGLKLAIAAGLSADSTFSSASPPVSVLEMAAVAVVDELRDWAKRFGCYCRKWRLVPGKPKYESATAIVYAAFDVERERDVCVKIMRRRQDWQHEISARLQLQTSTRCNAKESTPPIFTGVVPLIAHQEVSISDRHQRILTSSASTDNYDDENGIYDSRSQQPSGTGEWILIMPLGDRSLDEIVYKERVAGLSLQFVVQASRDIAQCLQLLHQHGQIHGDLKPRNICRFGENLQLIDLDAAACCDPHSEDTVGRKAIPGFCSAYAPPELAKALLLTAGTAQARPKAAPSFDVWSFGAVVYELAAGVSLFHCDRCADYIVGNHSKVELLNWSGMDDRRRSLIFPSHGNDSNLFSAQREDAIDLIAWCLNPIPSERPTVEQILHHRFLSCTDAAECATVPVTYHFFLSHFQKESADLTRSIYMLLIGSGCSCWLDMEANDLTLDGMQSGVRDSNVFLLILTRGTLFRPYCIEEIAVAVETKKKVIIVVEDDPKHFKFNYIEWQQQWQPGKAEYDWCLAELTAMNGGRDNVARRKLHDVATLLEANKLDMISYRRRNYESKAMVAEILKRTNLYSVDSLCVQQRHQVDELNDGVASSLAILYDDSVPGTEVAGALAGSLRQRGFKIILGTERDCPDVGHVQAVVLVLTSGVLANDINSDGNVRACCRLPGSTGSTHRLQLNKKIIKEVIAAFTSQSVKFEVVMHNWPFGSREQITAQQFDSTLAVVFQQKECIPFRPAQPPYEHKAMCDELLHRFAEPTLRGGHVNFTQIPTLYEQAQPSPEPSVSNS